MKAADGYNISGIAILISGTFYQVFRHATVICDCMLRHSECQNSCSILAEFDKTKKKVIYSFVRNPVNLIQCDEIYIFTDAKHQWKF